MKGIHIFLAEGFEDMEAVCTVDVLRRGGIGIRTVSITGDSVVTSSHGLPLRADLSFDEFQDVAVLDGTTGQDVLIFPGGLPGTKHLADCAPLMDLMKLHYAGGGTVAAICAAPSLVVSQLPIEGTAFTCYDGMDELPRSRGGVYRPEGVVGDGRLITGRGPGFATAFGLAILRQVAGEAVADRVRAGLLL